MFKKSSSIVLNTKNSPFEELYNFLSYTSSSTKLKEIVMVPDEKGNIRYSGCRTMNVPFREKMGSTAPSEVNIHVNGRVDSEGNSVTTYTLSDKYKEYVEATEKVHITKDGTVRVNLKYTVKESENSGSIMGSIKSRAYNAMVSSVESHVIGLYTSKRSLCFCKNPKCDIKTSEDFLRHFGEKY